MNVYEQSKYAIQNALDLCETAEFLRSHNRYDKAFIFASFSIEEIGKVFTMLNKSIEIDVQFEKTYRFHEQKEFAFQVLWKIFNFVFANSSPGSALYESVGQCLQKCNEDVFELVQNGLSGEELFNQGLKIVYNRMREMVSEIDESQVIGLGEFQEDVQISLFQDRNTLLYVDENTVFTPEQRWNKVLSRSKIAQQIQSGTDLFDMMKFMCHHLEQWLTVFASNKSEKLNEILMENRHIVDAMGILTEQEATRIIGKVRRERDEEW